MSQVDRAHRIQATMMTPGWQDILAMIDEQMLAPKERLYEILASKPEALTGRIAIGLAARSAALRDLKESLEDELKILIPTPKRGGS